jgi:hypothetical protein
MAKIEKKFSLIQKFDKEITVDHCGDGEKISSSRILQFY